MFFLCLQVICVVFVCAAFTLDIFCLIFVPLHWLFFVASTYVLFNYIWHTGEYVDYLFFPHTYDRICQTLLYTLGLRFASNEYATF